MALSAIRLKSCCKNSVASFKCWIHAGKAASRVRSAAIRVADVGRTSGSRVHRMIAGAARVLVAVAMAVTLTMKFRSDREIISRTERVGMKVPAFLNFYLMFKDQLSG